MSAVRLVEPVLLMATVRRQGFVPAAQPAMLRDASRGAATGVLETPAAATCSPVLADEP
jgi:hypothetical protein